MNRGRKLKGKNNVDEQQKAKESRGGIIVIRSDKIRLHNKQMIMLYFYTRFFSFIMYLEMQV
jgi:hypothetical protein